jgi:hypothetical protein
MEHTLLIEYLAAWYDGYFEGRYKDGDARDVLLNLLHLGDVEHSDFDRYMNLIIGSRT